MRSYQHFTLEERESLRIKRGEGKSLRQIARELDRNVSSISRELKRNGNKDGSYNAWRGVSLYLHRRKNSRRQLRIETDEALRHFVIKGLDQYWSPEIISEKWNEISPQHVSHSTIYAVLKRKALAGYTERSHLRRRGVRKFCKGNTKADNPKRSIHERLAVIDARARLGDWEGDTVSGGINKGSIVTLVDRKSRYLILSAIKNKTALETGNAICHALRDVPVHSLTFDNGTEFTNFQTIEAKLTTIVYFADPHSPWQRGSNENINGLLRWFFPKGCDFRQFSDQDLAFIAALVNNRPRKCLGWLSPAQVFFSACCT